MFTKMNLTKYKKIGATGNRTGQGRTSRQGSPIETRYTFERVFQQTKLAHALQYTCYQVDSQATKRALISI